MRRFLIYQGAFWAASALFWATTGISWWAPAIDYAGEARLAFLALIHCIGIMAGAFALSSSTEEKD